MMCSVSHPSIYMIAAPNTINNQDSGVIVRVSPSPDTQEMCQQPVEENYSSSSTSASTTSSSPSSSPDSERGSILAPANFFNLSETINAGSVLCSTSTLTSIVPLIPFLSKIS